MSLPEHNSTSHIIQNLVRNRDSKSLPDAGGDWKQTYTNKLRAALSNINPRLFGTQDRYDDEKGPGADR